MHNALRPFWFMRHGETDWNAEGRLQGVSDPPLNETGMRQAREAARLLRGLGIERVVSSPLARALQTAEIAAAALGTPLVQDTLLMERDFGPWEGENTNEVKKRHGLLPQHSITSILPPGAEQWPQTKARIQQAILGNLAAWPGQTLLFVSHGAVFRALHESLCGGWREAANALPYRFTPGNDGKNWRFESPFHPQEPLEAIDRQHGAG